MTITIYNVCHHKFLVAHDALHSSALCLMGRADVGPLFVLGHLFNRLLVALLHQPYNIFFPRHPSVPPNIKPYNHIAMCIATSHPNTHKITHSP